jgi:homoserine trans-succinylase
MQQESNQKKKNGVKKDISKSYNQFKEFQRKNYTGLIEILETLIENIKMEMVSTSKIA